MEQTSVFTHRLDLALRLVDTTTGRNISGRTARILIDGKQFHFGEKSDSLLILQNLEHERFQLNVTPKGYETLELEVDRTKLDKTLPLLEVHMIPSASDPSTEPPLLRLEGTQEGMTSLLAVRESDHAILARDFDPRKRLLTVFNPHHLSLDRIHYALVDPDRHRCEPFRVEKSIHENTIKLDHMLEMPIRNSFPVSPIVFGRTEADGSYRLMVRDDRTEAKWLIRAEVNGAVWYRRIDFRAEAQPDWEVM